MRERVLRDFFLDKASARELDRDLRGSIIRRDEVHSSVRIEDMDDEFAVKRGMLVKLCDAVISGHLRAENLAVVGFALGASDKFVWDADDDELMANILNDWACPEVNLELNVDNVRRFKSWLMDEEPYPQRPPLAFKGSNIISVREKVYVGSWKRKLRDLFHL